VIQKHGLGGIGPNRKRQWGFSSFLQNPQGQVAGRPGATTRKLALRLRSQGLGSQGDQLRPCDPRLELVSQPHES
jgi:hypothetical protein